MSQDDLKNQLENLFSDISVPEPDVSWEAVTDVAEAEGLSAFEAALPSLETPSRSPAEIADAQLSTPEGDRVDEEPAEVAAEELLLSSGQRQGLVSRVFHRTTVRWRSRLGRSLVLAFMLAAIVPAFIIAVFGALSQASRLRADVSNNLELLASLQEKQINQWVQAQNAAFTALAHDPPLVRLIRTFLVADQREGENHATRLSIQSSLSSFRVQHPGFDELFILNVDGRVVVTTDAAHMDHIEKDTHYFVYGRDASYYEPPTYVARRKTLSLVVAEPLRYITGETIGVIVGYVAVDALTELMHSAPGLGKTDEAYLVNEEGTLITALREAAIPSPGNGIHSPGIEEVIARRSGRETYNNYAGQSVLGVYKWLPELQIGLIAEREVTEAFRSVFVAAGAFIIVAVVAVALTVLLANQMARRIARPVVQITEAARQMVAGDLEQSVKIERTDEIGALGQAFNHMAEQLRATVAGLEKTVAERTQQLKQATDQFRKRATHLEASAEISRAAASILDPQHLMQTTVELIRDRFHFYHVSLFLLDKTESWAVVRASTGQVGQQMVTQPHRLRVGGESMVGWVCANHQPRIALDVGTDAVHFDNPLLPHTRSELVMPLIIGERFVGALDVQSTEEAAFDEDDLRTLQGMADLIAIALQNARLFLETQRRAEHQRFIASFNDRLQQAGSSADILAVTLEHLGETFNLAQATLCLGAQSQRTAEGNGPEHGKVEKQIG